MVLAKRYIFFMALPPGEIDVPILMYHHVHPVPGPASLTITQELQDFIRQLDTLQHYKFTTITFGRLFRKLDGGQPLPPKPVLITFDDGYESFYEFVYPALASRKMVGTVFVVASQIGGYNRWDAERGAKTLRLLSAGQIQELIAGGMEIGVHGWAHRDLTACSEAEAREEIVRAKQEIEKRLGVRPQVFCYCYGKYATQHFPLLQEAGFSGATAGSTIYRHVTSERFAMRRLNLNSTDAGLRLRLKLSPLFLRYIAVRERRQLIRAQPAASGR
jgi:peptidoglycan/xylan/chitin deacetylase (PgdA/CDA1 family)